MRERLAKRASKAGIQLSEAAIVGLSGYFELLRKWNRKVSLT
jgi:16S rRNA G527 N7-methylase RsmG